MQAQKPVIGPAASGVVYCGASKTRFTLDMFTISSKKKATASPRIAEQARAPLYSAR
jgi:hypothetical protein